MRGPNLACRCATLRSAEAETALLRALEQHGADVLARNASGVTLRLYDCGERVVPVTVTDTPVTGARMSCVRPSGHYIDYPAHEIGKHSRLWGEGRLRRALWPLRKGLDLTAFDKAIYVNQSLRVRATELAADRANLAALRAQLLADHPNHAVICSNIVPGLAPELAASLRALGGVFVPSRRVWVYDAMHGLPGKRYRTARTKNNRMQRKLVARDPDRVSGEALLPHVERMAELYRGLYIDKHSALNPDYLPPFFALMVASPTVRANGWLNQRGEIEVFHLQMAAQGTIHWSAHGYDQTAPRERRLNELMAADNFAYAEALGGRLNWGGGANEFKRTRGAEPLQEYDVVFVEHLPSWRQTPWLALQRLRRPKAPDVFTPRGEV